MDRFPIFLALLLVLSLRLTAAEESCTESLTHSLQYQYQLPNYIWYFYPSSVYWNNMTFWDGHVQIPEKDNVASECFTSFGDVLALTEKHPKFEEMTENILEVQACSLTEERVCVWNWKVFVRKCSGTLLYMFPNFQTDGHTMEYHVICFDRIQLEVSRNDTVSLQSTGNRFDNVLKFPIDQYGWIDTYIEGRQFVFPSIEDDLWMIIEKCEFSSNFEYVYFLKEPVPKDIREEPTRLIACKVYINDGSYTIKLDDDGNCYNFIYVRSYKGRLQFDLSVTYFRNEICLIHHSNIKVQPEITHEESVIIEDGGEVSLFTPILQYRCAFDIIDDTQYIANWYVNRIFQIQTGPSSFLDDLVFRKKYLINMTDGYEVHCGIFPSLENETTEAISNAYFAGWKIRNKDISLSKSGVATVVIEQTIPIGCSYVNGFAASCLETISFEDLVPKAESCDGIKVTNSDDPSKSFIEIKSLKKGEKWTRKEHSLLLSTIYNNYDDRTNFHLQVTLSLKSNGDIGRPITSKTVGAVQVMISNIKRHWSKRCYSHVDPHMKTVEGLHYEAQREGDYMLLLNEKYQTEIQTSARYCRPGNNRGPVCACGIAIAVGADTFIINRCHDQRFKFDLTCKDGGVMDIERVHDYRYQIGGNRSNDFEHRVGAICA